MSGDTTLPENGDSSIVRGYPSGGGNGNQQQATCPPRCDCRPCVDRKWKRAIPALRTACCRECRRLAAEFHPAAFAAVMYAVCRLGEMAQLDKDIKIRFPEVPWGKLTKIRDVWIKPARLGLKKQLYHREATLFAEIQQELNTIWRLLQGYCADIRQHHFKGIEYMQFRLLEEDRSTTKGVPFDEYVSLLFSLFHNLPTLPQHTSNPIAGATGDRGSCQTAPDFTQIKAPSVRALFSTSAEFTSSAHWIVLSAASLYMLEIEGIFGKYAICVHKCAPVLRNRVAHLGACLTDAGTREFAVTYFKRLFNDAPVWRTAVHLMSLERSTRLAAAMKEIKDGGGFAALLEIVAPAIARPSNRAERRRIRHSSALAVAAAAARHENNDATSYSSASGGMGIRRIARAEQILRKAVGQCHLANQRSFWRDARSNNFDDVRSQIRYNIQDVNFRDHAGNTALHHLFLGRAPQQEVHPARGQVVVVAKRGNPSPEEKRSIPKAAEKAIIFPDSFFVICSDLLVNLGGDMRITNNEGLTAASDFSGLSPLLKARLLKQLCNDLAPVTTAFCPILEHFDISTNLDPERKNNQQILHVAAQKGHWELVDYLVNHKNADPWVCETPAQIRKSKSAVKNHSAKGFTPLDYAKCKGCQKSQRLLEDAMARMTMEPRRPSATTASEEAASPTTQ